MMMRSTESSRAFFGDGFRDAALLRFKQNGFGVYTGGILQGIDVRAPLVRRATAKIGHGRIGTAHVEHRVAVHVEEHLIDHVGDVKLGLVGFSDVLCFGQGTTEVSLSSMATRMFLYMAQFL